MWARRGSFKIWYRLGRNYECGDKYYTELGNPLRFDFSKCEGTSVWRLPYTMKEDRETTEALRINTDKQPDRRSIGIHSTFLRSG